MSPPTQLVVGTIDEQRYALHLSIVERIVRAVAVTPLPQAPDIILGVIDVQGQVTPVVNMRKRLHLPERAIELSDRFIVARTTRRPVIVVMDTVIGVMEYADTQIVSKDEILSAADYMEGMVKLPDGLIFIHGFDTFLSLEDGGVLSQTLQTA